MHIIRHQHDVVLHKILDPILQMISDQCLDDLFCVLARPSVLKHDDGTEEVWFTLFE